MTSNIAIVWIIKPIIWSGGVSPLVWLVWLAYIGELGFNPIEFVNRYLGGIALNFIVITLAVTPFRIFTSWSPILRVRRLLGLFAFFYACAHFCFYVGVEQFFSWSEILQDILKRKFITVGMFSFCILILLAATSTKAMVKRLGGKGWKRLHQGIYLAAALACVHFFMMRKGIQLEPIYFSVFLVLMYFFRIIYHFRRTNQ